MFYAKIKSLALFGCSVVLVGNASAFVRSGTMAAEFLKFNTDARGSAMAGASAASWGGSSTYWSGSGGLLMNPASAAGTILKSFSLSQQSRYAEIDNGQFGFVSPFRENICLAASASWVSVPEQEITTLENQNGTGRYYDYSDFNLNVGTALRLTDRLNFGVSAKYVSQTLHNEKASGLAFDLGVLMRTGFRNLRLGMVLANFGSKMQLRGEDLLISGENDHPANIDTEEFQMPLVFRIAIADEIYNSNAGRVDAFLQAEHPNDNKENLRLGLEYGWQEHFFLRCGKFWGRDLENYSAGFGLLMPLPGSKSKLSLDFAWVDYDHLDAVKQFSLGFKF
jgi:hypothetical protein